MKWLKRFLWVVGVVMIVGAAGIGYETKTEAHRLITNPMATRKLPTRTPADYQVPFEDVRVTTTDGLKLAGWYLPSPSGVAVMFVHGYKDSRSNMVESAAMYHRHGYGVLLLSVRAHDQSDGEMLSFGHQEMKDLEAWYRYLSARPDVKPDRIGMLGVSMGGALSIQYAAQNPHIQALVTDCAFSSMTDTIETSVTFFTGLPPFPFAPLIGFWAGREGGFSIAEIDAKKWIGRLSPRPVFLMQGGADRVISPRSGELLYQAAGEPKELWFDPALGHARFFAERRDEYERRVLGFWDKYLQKEPTP
jgi:fermentation-respiration switch protein FrsA (DUF1100 family)